MRLNRLMASNTACSPLPGQDPELSKQIKINSHPREDIHRLTEELPMNNPCISLHSRQPLQDTVTWDPASPQPTLTTPNRQPKSWSVAGKKDPKSDIFLGSSCSLQPLRGRRCCYPEPDHDWPDLLHTKAPTRLPDGLPRALPLPTAMH